jgi:hypothetical protein
MWCVAFYCDEFANFIVTLRTISAGSSILRLIYVELFPSNFKALHYISWTDHVRNEEELLRVNEQRNIVHEIRKRKAN